MTEEKCSQQKNPKTITEKLRIKKIALPDPVSETKFIHKIDHELVAIHQ